MDIKLKNLKVNLTFSEETIMFQADVYIDGVKALYASNEGRGGSTDYFPYEGKRDLMLKAQEYCNSLPSDKSKYGETEIEIKMNLEYFIDKLVEAHVNDKEKKRFEKKLLKNMEKGICHGNMDSYQILSWKGHTIASLLSNTMGRVTLQRKVDELRREGKNILNTNLPF